MFNEGDYVLYRKYSGCIFKACENNMYMVELYHYGRFGQVYKLISGNELCMQHSLFEDVKV